MDLSIHDIIIRPKVTTKAQRLNRLEKKLLLEVHPAATKPMIARAIKALFNAEVEKIGIVVSQGKRRYNRKNRTVINGKRHKCAIITLKAGSMSEVEHLSGIPQGFSPETSGSE